MNDETKAANEALVESMLRQLRGCVSVGDEMTLDHACLIDDAADWIASEPARTAAAVAAAREEQREADAKFCPNCLGVGFVERPVPCPYCDDSTHDHYCPTGTQRQQCGCGAERIRATPITATPLADRLAAAEARVEELKKQLGERVDRHDRDGKALMVARARIAELEAGLASVEQTAARVAELEKALADAVAIAREFDARQQKAEARVKELEAEVLAWRDMPARILYENQRKRAEKAEAERDEAVAALRRLVGASAMLLGRFQRLHDSDVLREVNEQPTDNALEQARAVLAKYPEER